MSSTRGWSSGTTYIRPCWPAMPPVGNWNKSCETCARASSCRSAYRRPRSSGGARRPGCAGAKAGSRRQWRHSCAPPSSPRAPGSPTGST
eukprot:13250618-Alexandrium_andersonii.AAC.1